METSALIEKIQAIAGSQPVDAGLILGSGLGGFSDEVDGVAIEYADLPGFPHAGVSGHSPKLVIGNIGPARVVVFGGRVHYYEGGKADAMRLPLEVLKGLGATQLVLTNAAGSVRQEIQPGDLMVITDHINFSGLNPLIGEQSDERFVAMAGAYDGEMIAGLRAAAAAENVELHSGVYIWFSGPTFETPAEIRATQILGGDAVGMSTVPEVILARFLGLKAGAISAITNMGAGLSDEKLSHAHTKKMALSGAGKLAKILLRYFASTPG